MTGHSLCILWATSQAVGRDLDEQLGQEVLGLAGEEVGEEKHTFEQTFIFRMAFEWQVELPWYLEMVRGKRTSSIRINSNRMSWSLRVTLSDAVLSVEC